MFLISRHLHQTTPLSKWCFCLNGGTFPGVMEPGAALPRPPLLPKIGLLCPQYGCSALLWTLQHCHSCSCSTWLRSSATVIHIQHCRETTMQEGECRITLQARIASWALEAWELGTATQEDRLVPFPGRKSSVLNLLQTTEKWVNYLRQSIPIWWISFARFHDTIKWKPFYSESWTLQKTFPPLVYPPTPSACP